MMQKMGQSMQIVRQSFPAVLFPGYRRRVLGMLLLHPQESLHAATLTGLKGNRSDLL